MMTEPDDLDEPPSSGGSGWSRPGNPSRFVIRITRSSPFRGEQSAYRISSVRRVYVAISKSCQQNPHVEQRCSFSLTSHYSKRSRSPHGLHRREEPESGRAVRVRGTRLSDKRACWLRSVIRARSVGEYELAHYSPLGNGTITTD